MILKKCLKYFSVAKKIKIIFSLKYKLHIMFINIDTKFKKIFCKKTGTHIKCSCIAHRCNSISKNM